VTKPTKILRAKESGKFTERFTDEDFLRTVDECLKEATCTAGEVADKLGCNARYARNRLVELEEKGKLTKKLKGTSWGFRP
jgi:predicted ArsR family transcriptional regulator